MKILLALLIAAFSCAAYSQTIESLMPHPKTAWAYPDTSRFTIGQITMLVLPSVVTPEVERAASWTEREVLRRCGIKLQRRTIFYYLRTVPPFQSAIVLCPLDDPDASFFTPRIISHGENFPSRPGGYILDIEQTETILLCNADDDGSFNGVTTFLNMLNSASKSAQQCHIWDEPDYPLRWIYSQHNLQVTSNVGVLRTIADTMATAKLNGIYQNDFKLGILDQVIPQYFKNTDTLKRVWDDRNVEVIPGVCAIGYSSNILYHDPQLAEGIEARTNYVIQGDTGRLIPNASVAIPNGGFEQVDGNGKFTGFSFYDACFQQDKTTFHSGAASAKATNMPAGTNARFNRQLTCKPHEYYSLSVWIKTDQCQCTGSGHEMRVMVLGDAGNNLYPALTFSDLNIPATGDWRKAEVFFNTLNFTKIILYAGLWTTGSGTFWLDDFEIKPAGLTNVLRRGGTPLTVSSVTSGIQYKETVDYDYVYDTWWDKNKNNIGPYHTPPTFHRTTSSALKNGDTVEVKYYHPFAAISDNQGNGSVMVCVSEDTLYKILDKQIRSVDALYKSNRYFMGHDEIRSLNHDQACLSRGLSAAELLADNLHRCDTLIKNTTPGAQTFVWSDMFDPNHNAVNNYYLINGDLRGVWDLIPKSPVIVNWNSGQKQKSMSFFADAGFSQITAPYYDVGNTSTIRSWRIAQESVPNMLGMMYTTWSADYRFLPAFGYYSWSAGPYIMHTPFDSTIFNDSMAQITANILADPFDAADAIVSAEMVISKTSLSQVPHTIGLEKSTGWQATFPTPDVEWFRYYIHATNKQGLEKMTPMYLVQRAGSDTISNVNDEAESLNFTAYPNPVTTMVTLSFTSTTSSEWSLEIYDVLGQLVLQKQGHCIAYLNVNVEAETASLPPGRYVVALRCVGRTSTLPMVVIGE